MALDPSFVRFRCDECGALWSPGWPKWIGLAYLFMGVCCAIVTVFALVGLQWLEAAPIALAGWLLIQRGVAIAWGKAGHSVVLEPTREGVPERRM